MITVYLINKITLIINAVCFLGAFFAVLFLPITGVIQMSCFLFYLVNWKKIDPKLKNSFKIYGFSSAITLLIQLGYYVWTSLDFLFWVPITLGIFLAIFFFSLARKQKNYLKY